MVVNEGRKGYKKSELGWIPEDWEIKKLSNCTIGKAKYGINASATDFSKKLPIYLRITDIDENGKFRKEKMKCVDHPQSNKYILLPDDIIFVRTGSTTGKTYLHNDVNGELVYAGFLIKFTPNKKIISPYFLKLFAEGDTYWRWVKVMSARSGQPGINGEEYGNLKIPIPLSPNKRKSPKFSAPGTKPLNSLKSLYRPKPGAKKV